MTLVDLKGHLLARRGNLHAQLQQYRQEVVLMEANLATARKLADEAAGGLRATEEALADVDRAMQAAGNVVAQPVQAPGNGQQ